MYRPRNVKKPVRGARSRNVRDLRCAAFVGVVVPLAGGVLPVLAPVTVPFSDADVVPDADIGSDASEVPLSTLGVDCALELEPVLALESDGSEEVAGTEDCDCRDDIDTDEEVARWPLFGIGMPGISTRVLGHIVNGRSAYGILRCTLSVRVSSRFFRFGRVWRMSSARRFRSLMS